MKPRLIVDCDQVVVCSAYAWWTDLEMTTKAGKQYEEVKHLYDYTKAYKQELRDRGMTGFEWWKQHHIYDDLKPIKDSVEVLDWASDYFDVVFVSVIRGDHGGSKADFIKRYFPFQKGIAWSKEKYLIDGVCIIDDRFENLNEYNPEALKIFYDAGHEQYVESSCEYKRATNWIEVRDILMEEYF